MPSSNKKQIKVVITNIKIEQICKKLLIFKSYLFVCLLNDENIRINKEPPKTYPKY